MVGSGHSLEGKTASAARGGGGRAPSDDEDVIHSPEQAEAAVEAAWEMLAAVFERAHSCCAAEVPAEGLLPCRLGPARRRADPLFAPTGGCPVMKEAEWEVVQLGAMCQRLLLGDLLHAMEEAEADGRMPPSSAARPGRKTVPWPLSWAEWLSLDPVGRLRDFEREAAAFAGEWE